MSYPTAAAHVPLSASSLLLDALRLPGSTSSRLSDVSEDAAVALAGRIAALLGGSHHSDQQHPSLDLTVDGQSTLLAIPADDPTIVQLLTPLCLWLRGLVAAAPTGRRVVVGVVGAAGAGKSYLCAVLAALLCRLAEQEEEQGQMAVTVSMDAYHLPNAELEALGVMHLKGHPETLDAAALLRDLQRLRTIEQGDVALPIYERQLHDPVPGGLVVRPAHRLVLVEGLHLLHGDDPAWAPLQTEALDAALFLDLPKSLCRQRVVARKVRNGRAPADAEAHFRRVDEPIFDRLQRHDRERADLVLHFPSFPSSSCPCPTAVSLQHRLLHATLSGPLDTEAEEARRKGLAESVPPADKPRILTLGLNPCVQKVLRFDGPLVVGDVNRAASVSAGVGGKGQNFAKAARVFGACGLAIAQWLGGASGTEVARQLGLWGTEVDLITQPVQGATRTCCSLLHRKPQPPAETAAWEEEEEDDDDDEDDDDEKSPSSIADIARSASSTSSPMTAAARARLAAALRRPLTPFVLTTEIVEPGAAISAHEEEALITALCAYVEQGRGLRAVAVMGSLPTSVGPEYYARVLSRIWPLLAPLSPLLFLDTVVGLDALLSSRIPVTMLKVNAAEARGVVQASSSPVLGKEGAGDEEGKEENDRRFCAAVRRWLERHWQVRFLAVTNGPLQARLFHLQGTGGGDEEEEGNRLVVYTFHVPFIPPHDVVNPIGAGDTCSAVTLSALLTPPAAAEEKEEEEEKGATAAAAAVVHAFRLGLAAATASCLKEENSTYDLPTLWSVAGAIRVEARVE